MKFSDKKIIGLTGGIGSGKSAAGKVFAANGFPVYDSDFWAKEIVNSNRFLKEKIVQIFGSDSYDENGLYNRKYISQRVFGNDELLTTLNETIHPAVKLHFENWIYEQNSEFLVKETALLFELNLDKNCDYSILVTADESIRIERVMQRDHRTIEEVQAIIQKQMPETEKMKRADFVIINNGTFEELKTNTQKVIKQIKKS